MQVVPLFSAAEVQARIAELAARLFRDYADSPLAVLRISAGAVRFVDELRAELARIGARVEVHDVRARRLPQAELGAVQVDAFDPLLLDGRDVLVVGDIVDEGATLEAVLDIVGLADVRSVRTAVLVEERSDRRAAVVPDYVGFEVAAGRVAGFGMSIDGELADLDEIGVVIDED
jgi:hypoxanthine phosphoribosyltransferase